jgi:DNA-binding protein HU-beta
MEAFFTTVKDSLSEKENIYIRGFGSFVTKVRAQKTVRNILLKQTVIVPAYTTPFFKPASEFVDMVKQRK